MRTMISPIIIFKMVNITLENGINKLKRVNSPNRDANTNLDILLNLFKVIFIVKRINKSNKKFIIINMSMYIIILSPI